MPNIPIRDPPPEDALVMEKNKKLRIYLKHINAEQAMLTSIKQQVDRTFSYNTIFVEQAMLTSTY